MTTLNERWADIMSAAKSADPFDRTFALSASVSCLEIGLLAVGVERRGREGVQSRLRRWAEANLKPEGTRKEDAAAFEARNDAVHKHAVVEPEACEQHIDVLFEIWRALRRAYVTREKAAALAEQILDSTLVTDVFLFGSLTRRKREPSDIDLLFYDEGDISALNWRGYSSRDFAALENDILDSWRAPLNCGWLDFVFVDGKSFGKDPAYTLRLCQNQPDPLFMVNISDGLLRFDSSSKRWIDRRPPIFERLANLRRGLEIENVVGAYRRPRKRLTPR